MNTVFEILGVVGSVVVSMWAFFKYVLLGSYRLDDETSKRIIELIEREASFKWTLTGSYVVSPKFPDVYDSVVLLRGIPIRFSRTERLLTAGWKGKDTTSDITFLRWSRSRIDSILDRREDRSTVPVMAVSPGGSDRLGEITCDPNVTTVLDPILYEDIERDVAEVVSKGVGKTGFLLHGPPGMGKTQFVKYIARKYALPINVVYLNPEYNNLDIAVMFSSIPPQSVVLFEDFDNYFHGRECAMKNDQVKFTFDAIINSLDGVHNDYNGIVFAMTVNDIEKVDDSIKRRPSRFKFVKEFGPPSRETRMRILGDPKRVDETDGMSLDQVFVSTSA